MKRQFVLLILLMLVACSADTVHENLGTASSALNGATGLAKPIQSPGATKSNWVYSLPDLYVADAWTECSFMRQQADDVTKGPDTQARDSSAYGMLRTNPRPALPGDGYHDDYLERVLAEMTSTTCDAFKDKGYTNPLTLWYQQRTTASCNRSADLASNVSVPLDAEARVMMGSLASDNYSNPYAVHPLGGAALDAMLREPGINACIASKLRQVAPGGASGSALLLSADDQLALLERSVERGVEAVLGYAQLVRLQKVAPDATLRNHNGTYLTQLELAVDFLQHDQEARSLLAPEMQSAMQGLVAAASELASLYARNASAGAQWRQVPGSFGSPFADAQSFPYPDGALRADKYWGRDGWIDRVMILLYGSYYRSAGGWDVTDSPVPYVQADTDSPTVQEAVSLARSLDVIDIKKDPGMNGVADLPGTAAQLYRALEAGLETRACTTRDVAGTCLVVSPASIPDPSANPSSQSSSLLWTRHGISPEAVASASARLSQQLVDSTTSDGHSLTGGAWDVLGDISTRALSDGAYWHIPGDSTWLPRSLPRVQGRYAHDVSLDYPYPYVGADGTIGFDANSHPFSYGYPDGTGQTALLKQQRLMGVVPALVLARENLVIASGGNLASIENQYVEVLDAIAAAVGVDAVLNVQNYTVVYSPQTTDYTGGAILAVPGDDVGPVLEGNRLGVSVTLKSGKVMADLNNSGTTMPMLGVVARSASTKQPFTRWLFGSTSGTLGIRDASGPIGYLAGPSRFDGGTLYIGTAFRPFRSVGGSLNGFAERLLVPRNGNPAEPAFDGFGLPTHEAPPGDNSVLGTTAGTAYVQHYLDDAQASADAATAAVNSALQDLIQIATQAQDAAKQQQKSTQAVVAAVAALCGPGECRSVEDLALQRIELLNSANLAKMADLLDRSVHGVPVDPSDPPNYDIWEWSNQKELARIAYRLFLANAVQINVPKAVVDALASRRSPEFGDYGGGELQSSLQQVLFAIQDANASVLRLGQTYDAADRRLRAAGENAKVDQMSIDWGAQCNTDRGLGALLGGMSFGLGGGSGSGTGGFSISLGGFESYVNACLADGDRVFAAEQDAEIRQAFEAKLSISQSLLDLGGQVQQASEKQHLLSLSLAQIQQQVEKANLAVASAKLDAKLASEVSSGLSVVAASQNYDVWRAGALLEAARRSALTARRAIESYYVVDLSRMDANEPFVAAPSSWANDVFRYDLSAPSAVGLVSSSGLTNGVYANAITDYVNNLKQFVRGFGVARPTLSTHGDTELLSLPGPSGLVGAGAVPGGIVDPTAYRWSYLCADGKWLQRTAASLTQLCPSAQAGPGTAPLRARLDFTLDPWGRLDGLVSSPPYSVRYNTRFGRIAVNLVGTGVLDCTKSSDPQTCYSSPFVRFNMLGAGPAWVTDFTQTWHTVETPFLHVEAAKALAAEQWLDPVSNSWSQPFVAAIARSELADRPIGGAYALEFDLSPEVVLDRVARVQILSENSYWLRQQ